MGRHPAVIDAIIEAALRMGTAAAGTRNISDNSQMDGDTARLAGSATWQRNTARILISTEVRAVGRGAGITERDGVMDRIDVIEGNVSQGFRRRRGLHRRRCGDPAFDGGPAQCLIWMPTIVVHRRCYGVPPASGTTLPLDRHHDPRP